MRTIKCKVCGGTITTLIKGRRYYCSPKCRNIRKYTENYTKWKILHRYGITMKDYTRIFLEQKGCCAICGKQQSELKETLCVDHDHTTGEVRGLLCRNCNIGKVGSNTIESCTKVVEYLRKHYEQSSRKT